MAKIQLGPLTGRVQPAVTPGNIDTSQLPPETVVPAVSPFPAVGMQPSESVVPPQTLTPPAPTKSAYEIPEALMSDEEIAARQQPVEPIAPESFYSPQEELVTPEVPSNYPAEPVYGAEDTAANVALANLQTERAKQQQAVKYKNYDYSTLDAIQQAIPKLPRSEVSDIHGAANRMAESMLSTQFSRTVNEPDIARRIPNGLNGLEMMQHMLNTDNPVQAASQMTTAMAVLSQRFKTPQRDEKTGEVIPTADDGTFDAFMGTASQESADIGSLFDSGSPDETRQEYDGLYADDKGGIPLSNFESAAAKILKQAATTTAVDPITNEPIVTRPENYDPSLAGALMTKAAQDSGLIVIGENDKGEKMAYLNPIRGNDFRKAAKAVSAEFLDQTRAISQTVPVTPSGSLVGEQAGERRGSKTAPGRKIVDKVQKAATQLGRIPLSIVPEADYYRRIFQALAIKDMMQVGADGQPLTDRTGNLILKAAPDTSVFGKMFKLNESNFEENDNRSVEQRVRDKYNNMIVKNKLYSQNLQAGVPRYARHWVDGTVDRMYNDSQDANLQADKSARAIYGPPPKLMQISDKPIHENGVSKLDAEAFWSSIASNKPLTALGRELSFLMTLSHALSPIANIDVNSQIGPWLLENVTPARLRQWADWGRALKAAVPRTEDGRTPDRATISNLDPTKGNLDIPEGVMNVLRQIMQSSKDALKDDNWGFTIRGLISAADYMDAKEAGKQQFTPRLTTAIDQNSAGRSFTALDTGDLKVLERTGVLWDMINNAFSEGGSVLERTTLPYGTPRDYFIQKAMDVGIERAVGMRGGSNEDYVIAVKNAFDEAGSGFAKELAKKPLMTTDYGKPAKYHGDVARAVLRKYPDLQNALIKAIVNNTVNKNATSNDAEELLRDIIWKSLNATIDFTASQAAKGSQRFANMLNRVLNIKGANGEDISWGAFANAQSEDIVTIEGPDARTINLKRKKMVDDIGRSAGSKMIDGQLFNPRPGTFQINAIGPWMGQYRESLLTSGLVNYLNPEVTKPVDMEWIQTVHDNAILDSFSFAKALYHANNTIFPKVAEYSPSKAVFEAVQKIANQIDESLKGKLSVDGKVNVGLKGDFPLFFVELDYDYANLKNKEPAALTEKEKAYLKYLEDPRSGYIVPDLDENGNVDYETNKRSDHLINEHQYKNLIKQWLNHNSLIKQLNDWAMAGDKSKQAILPKIKDIARRGHIAFFN